MSSHTKFSEADPALRYNKFLSTIENVSFHFLFGLAIGATLWIIWGNRILPMVDLPGFSAGIKTLNHMLSWPDSEFHQFYQIDLLQPYILPFLLGALLIEWFDVVSATKIILSFAAVGAPLACWYLAVKARGDRWWSLLFFATFFGYAYLWGMVSQLVAIPLAVLFIAFCVEAVDMPDRKSAERIFFTGLAVVLCHGLVALFSLGIGGALLLFRRIRSWKSLSPMIAVILLFGIECYMLSRSVGALHLQELPMPHWEPIYLRLFEFFSSILGMSDDWYKAGVWVLFLLVVLHANKCSYNEQRRKFLPVLLFLVCVWAAPTHVAAKSILARSSSLIAAISTLGFAVPSSRIRRIILRVAIVALVTWQLDVNRLRAQAMEREIQPFFALLDLTSPNHSLVSVCYDCSLPGVGTPVLYHVGSWYQAEMNGIVAQYFPSTSPWVIRYREQFTHYDMKYWGGNLTSGAGFDFTKFAPVRYFVFHGNAEDLRKVRKDAEKFARLVEQAGSWALYENLNLVISPRDFLDRSILPVGSTS